MSPTPRISSTGSSSTPSQMRPTPTTSRHPAVPSSRRYSRSAPPARRRTTSTSCDSPRARRLRGLLALAGDRGDGVVARSVLVDEIAQRGQLSLRALGIGEALLVALHLVTPREREVDVDQGAVPPGDRRHREGDLVVTENAGDDERRRRRHRGV